MYSNRKMTKKHIAFLTIPNATLLDITGPYEVFAQTMEYIEAKESKDNIRYILHNVSAERNKNITTASGMTIHCQETIRDIDYDIDTLFIPGVPNSLQPTYKLNSHALNWIKEQAGKVRRLCSVCTGTFLLAEAGLLNGKKATTHWEKCEILGQMYPNTKVDPNSIFVKDRNIYTSAGISSGMDLALALVEEDFGKSTALNVARQMVLYLKRPGSQSQYSSVLTHQHTDYRPIQDICQWIEEHLEENITMEVIAEKCAMSVRNFTRVFTRETGISPGRYIDKLRVETACRYLVDTQLSMKEVAILCGLTSVDNMRKVFLKYISISPMDYRKNFTTTL